jgi:hypothetical protein
MINAVWELKLIMIVASFACGYAFGTISQIFLS